MSASGEQVVIKVQYPGIRSTFEADLHCIETIVWLARPNSVASFGEFANQVREELDFNKEKQSLQEIHDYVMPVFADRVAVPEVRHGLCSQHVLTMSFIPGQSIQDVASSQLQSAGVALPAERGKQGIRDWLKQQEGQRLAAIVGPDRLLAIWRGCERGRLTALWVGLCLVRALNVAPDWCVASEKALAASAATRNASEWVATLLAVTGYEMFTGGGLFQADPHPGNVLVMPDGRLGLIDYGQCKRLQPDVRRKLARLVISVADDAPDEEVATAFRQFGLVTKNDDTKFIAEFGRLIFGGVKSKSLDREWSRELFKRDGVTIFPAELVMVSRTVGLLRGFGLMVKCNVAVADHWRQYAESAL